MSAPPFAERDTPPYVPRLLHRLVAFAFVVAWASLGVQVPVLIGSRGLLPAAHFVDLLASRPDVGFLEAPTLFRLGASDGALALGVASGALFALLALFGVLPRLCLAATTLLYLSFTVVARSFLSFQWDNLLLECGALAVLLPRRHHAPWALFLVRVALFKLYFESGLAKYQSHLGDWKDGSAMRLYYETAPIPTWVAWYAHHLPPWFHSLESWGALGFELVVPFAIFFGRHGRLTAFVIFAGFQTLNVLTANYGFFSYLALILQVVLLDDRDVGRFHHQIARAVPKLARRVRRVRAFGRLARRRIARPFASFGISPTSNDGRTAVFLGRLALALGVSVTYLGASLDGGCAAFAPGAPRPAVLTSLANAIAPFRLVNTYHLFGHITRERIEPTFETFDGALWTEHDLHYKPGNVRRAPPFVAPHQPRVDFLLWFYGLSYEDGTPEYVQRLARALCKDPPAVRSLFEGTLPDAPQAVRISFYRYHFTTAEERRASGAFWTRTRLDAERTLPCRK